ncbi:MAG: L-histidine N(alpha)-methyltransferase [Myxococcales bacterium]|nr:L-histidine N(alpha)-methyltransferase [Myxococcales bacterium]
MTGYHVLEGEELSRLRDPTRDFALDVLSGLSEDHKKLDSRYFYDDEGSRLFQAIMGCDDYYPTDCEREILENHGRSIAATCAGAPLNAIDLGAGDGAKTKILLRALVAMGVDCRYVPIDISEGAIAGLVEKMGEEMPEVEVQGLVCEYTDGLNWLSSLGDKRTNLLLFLGSNIGNFNKPRARAFLRRQWTSLQDGDYALIGFDLKKDIEVLLRAYNDSDGYTAAFNKNLLTRINRELGGNFVPEKFRHYGTYDVFSGAMVSYLVSLEKQDVEIEALGRSFSFQAWEPVHTEYSYKYLESDIESLAAHTGYVIEAKYRDSKHFFVDSLWRVSK